MNKKILIFSAHCDDWETGMGGTMKRLIDAGFEVVSVITTLPQPEKQYPGFPLSALEVRMAESIQAHELVGLKPLFLGFSYELNFPVTLNERQRFAHIADNISPDMVITQWPVDVNPDHRSLGILSMEPFLQKGVNIELFFYEVFSDLGRPQSLGFYPSHYVDVTNELGAKEKMVKYHQSQSPELWKSCEIMQKARGREMGVNAAEAFIRITRYKNLDEGFTKIFEPSPFKLPRSMGMYVNPERVGLLK